MDNRGQVTLEALIAVIIITLIVGVLFFISMGNSLFADDSQMNDRALYIAKKNLETAKAQARDNFAAVASSTVADGAYEDDLIVESIDSYTKKVTSRVSWNSSALRPQKIELLTYLTDLQSALVGGLAGGGSGGAPVSGNWMNPQTYSTLNLGPGESATGLVVRSGLVYLTTSVSDKNKPTFFIVDTSNLSSPSIKSSLVVGSSLNAVKVYAHYAYVAQNDPATQLQVIDITSSSSPRLAASYSLPGVNDAVGESIFIANGYAYIGVQGNSGAEFKIVDITNPLSPASRGGYHVGGTVNGVFVKNNIAYLATANPSAPVVILDVTNPLNIVQLGTYGGSGGGGDSVFFVAGTTNQLYVGRDDRLQILDVTNPQAIGLLGSATTGGAVNGIVVNSYLAFLSTANPNLEFQAFNISNPASLSLWSSYNLSNISTGIDYQNNVVYMSVRSNYSLRILTSS